MVELADTPDLKSGARRGVGVRVPLGAPYFFLWRLLGAKGSSREEGKSPTEGYPSGECGASDGGLQISVSVGILDLSKEFVPAKTGRGVSPEDVPPSGRGLWRQGDFR